MFDISVQVAILSNKLQTIVNITGEQVSYEAECGHMTLYKCIVLISILDFQRAWGTYVWPVNYCYYNLLIWCTSLWQLQLSAIIAETMVAIAMMKCIVWLITAMIASLWRLESILAVHWRRRISMATGEFIRLLSVPRYWFISHKLTLFSWLFHTLFNVNAYNSCMCKLFSCIFTLHLLYTLILTILFIFHCVYSCVNYSIYYNYTSLCTITSLLFQRPTRNTVPSRDIMHCYLSHIINICRSV